MKTFGKTLILTAGIFCGYFDGLVASEKVCAPVAFVKSLVHATGSFFRRYGSV